MADRALIREALKALDVAQFVLGIHDASFPGEDAEDPGRGSPYSRGARRFFDFAASLGFDGVQLGPQGVTHAGSASPYEGTLFSKNPLSLPLGKLVDEGLLPKAMVERVVAERPAQARRHMAYRYVFDAFRDLVDELTAKGLQDTQLRTLAREYLGKHRTWLVPDALYGVLCRMHGQPYWRNWGHAQDETLFTPSSRDRLAEVERAHAKEIEAYALVQALLAREHHRLREHLMELGVAIYGDLQVGFSAQDEWAYQSIFLPGYRMGAPPSRTNPDGQPWGYAVLNPEAYGTPASPGPALQFVRARVAVVLEGCDGARIDHPHGWICPWVYRTDDPSPLHAVQNGARLFSSPDVPGHERLAKLAIARPDQLNRDRPRYADDWVRSLDAEQVDRFALLVDTVVAEAKAHGRDLRRLVCEVLSTMPYPVARILERHHLGRFRVMQKAKLDDPNDVYRTHNAEPPDWMMLGNHDTPSIWEVVKAWELKGQLLPRAKDLATRLTPRGEDPEKFAQQLASSPRLLVHGMLSDAFLSRARNVFVFFADLFGMEESYNLPGTVNEANWTLRVPPDFHERYADEARELKALDVGYALAQALRARGNEEDLALAKRLSAGR